MHQECGDLAAATRWSDTALELPGRAGDPSLVCYIWMRKSYIASDAGQADLAISLAEEGLTHAGSLSARLAAFVLRQRAHAYALAGDYDRCARALDQAFEYASDPSGDGLDLVPFRTPNYIEMQAAQCWITLGRPARALSLPRHGLAGWPPNFHRDFGLCLARLAAAHAGMGEPDPALDLARQALPIIADTGSYRAQPRLGQAADLLTGIGATERAAELRQAMRDVLGES